MSFTEFLDEVLQKSSPSYDELLNYIHPDDRDYVDKSIKKGLNEGPKDGIDYRIVLDNGEERTVHSRAEVIFNEKNIPLRVKGIVQDITEQKKARRKNPDPCGCCGILKRCYCNFIF